jgi:hypothetical protein
MTLDGMDTRIGLTARSYARVALMNYYSHLAWVERFTKPFLFVTRSPVTATAGAPRQ